jgi:hypothetical protein
MGGWRVSRFIPDTAETLMPFATNVINLFPRGKVLLLGAFSALLVAVAAPIIVGPPVAANSSLKCHDSAGNYEPCLTEASTSPRFSRQTTESHQAPSWTTTALYQQESWAITALDQPAKWKTTAIDQSAYLTTSAPAARRSTPGKRSAICGRRLIPCFFSALRSGFTHIASVAATMGQARPAKEHL